MTGRRQVGGRPTEEVDVGEHRQTGGTAVRVLVGHQVGLEPGVEVALGRGTTLDLGDARQPVDAQCAREVPGWWRARRLFDQVSERAAVGFGPGPVGGEDVRQVGRA